MEHKNLTSLVESATEDWSCRGSDVRVKSVEVQNAYAGAVWKFREGTSPGVALITRLIVVQRGLMSIALELLLSKFTPFLSINRGSGVRALFIMVISHQRVAHPILWLAKLTAVPYTRAFGDGPRNFEPRSSDVEDTSAVTPSPNNHTTPMGGRFSSRQI
ncbi:hypothetical protein TNCV_2868061 [Trichonephila clavipes]|nr:hypothetical protein TNCV_2868061 [Trichonephila clavipes]